MNETNEHNDEPLTFAEACRDEEIAKKDARIAELERRVEELTEERDRLRRENEEMEGALESDRKALANVIAEVERLTKENEQEQLRTKLAAELHHIAKLNLETAEQECERLTKEREHIEIALGDSTPATDGLNIPIPLERRVYNLALQLAEREEDRWRDITTAPKDGTYVLAWCSQRNRPRVVKYSEPLPLDMKRWWIDGKRLCLDLTHWQPLPQPPAIRAARAQPEDGK